MRETINLKNNTYALGLTSEVVYLQKPYWCNLTERQLKLSLIRPRHYFSYDKKVCWPLLIFLCGGAFQKMDRNVHMPELTYFAERGYVVANVEYSVLPYTEFPEPLEEIKAAIRFLRAHGEKFGIQKEKVVIMGESAGGYLAALVAATNGDPQYETGNYLEESSAVQLAVPFYPPTNLALMEKPSNLRVRTDNFPDVCSLVTENTVPMYMIHGTADDQVPFAQSIRLYDKLQEKGVEKSQLTLIEGANHADALCYKPEIKQRILEFLSRNL